MTAAERVLWRTAAQAAFDAARHPDVRARAITLKKALAGSGEWRMPDQRPLPREAFSAFRRVAAIYGAEEDAALRTAIAPLLAHLTDTAVEILDGIDVPCLPRLPFRKDLDG